MKGAQGRRSRRESAITLLEKQISAHEANNEFVSKILKDKNITYHLPEGAFSGTARFYDNSDRLLLGSIYRIIS